MFLTEASLLNNPQTYRKTSEEMDPFAGGKKSVANTDCQKETESALNEKSFIITTKQTWTININDPVYFMPFMLVWTKMCPPPPTINMLKLWSPTRLYLEIRNLRKQ